MRVRGDANPGKLLIHPIPNKEGWSLARFFENVEKIDEGYEYDEWTLVLFDTGNLQKDIENNFDVFLEAARIQGLPEDLPERVYAIEAQTISMQTTVTSLGRDVTALSKFAEQIDNNVEVIRESADDAIAKIEKVEPRVADLEDKTVTIVETVEELAQAIEEKAEILDEKAEALEEKAEAIEEVRQRIEELEPLDPQQEAQFGLMWLAIERQLPDLLTADELLRHDSAFLEWGVA